MEIIFLRKKYKLLGITKEMFFVYKNKSYFQKRRY